MNGKMMGVQGLGQIIILGSGETAAVGGQAFERAARCYSAPVRIAVLETPAGFELNSARVAGRVADYLHVRLQNYNPVVTLIPARRQGGEFSPDNPEILTPMLTSDVLFMGAGSPTYAARQLQGSLAWKWLCGLHQLGVSLVFTSAATIALGCCVLPVYEIYKAGEDPHWKPGLDLFGQLGLNLVVVPHWNNADGGAELDTSRCFIGQSRFNALLSELPEDETVLGLDEHTALAMDFESGCTEVMGSGQVHVIRRGQQVDYSAGDSFELTELGNYHLPDGDESELEQLRQARQAALAQLVVPPPDQDRALELMAQRQSARSERNWADADRLRLEIEALGWQVRDTPEGPQLAR